MLDVTERTGQQTPLHHTVEELHPTWAVNKDPNHLFSKGPRKCIGPFVIVSSKTPFGVFQLFRFTNECKENNLIRDLQKVHLKTNSNPGLGQMRHSG